MPITATKQALCNALYAFISQRSGIEYGNYQCGDWKATRECFNGDYLPMLRHGKQARRMLRYVELSGITAEKLIEATRAYSGRLQFIQRDKNASNSSCADCGAKSGATHKDGCNGGQHQIQVAVEYTTGQYFPTEYRKAACAVLAQAIWDHWRHDCGTGDDIRRRARREFGRSIASTWFN